jgi:hypothetical protein
MTNHEKTTKPGCITEKDYVGVITNTTTDGIIISIKPEDTSQNGSWRKKTVWHEDKLSQTFWDEQELLAGEQRKKSRGC